MNISNCFNESRRSCEQIGPELSEKILTESFLAVELLRRKVEIEDYDNKFLLETHVYFEYIYFYLHFVKRTLFAKSQNTNKINEVLEDISSTIFMSILMQTASHYPKEHQDKILKSMYNNLNKADREYMNFDILMFQYQNFFE